MSRKGSKSNPHDPSPAPEPDAPLDDALGREPANGTTVATEEEALDPAAEGEPANVSLTIKGTDKAARAAAKRFGGEVAPKIPVVATPMNDIEPPDEDPISALLSDGKNMVLVTRQRPRTVQGPDGQEHATNLRIPGSYSCPTSKAEIEELVFEQHGGSKYKCTIHPDTSDGANKILGHFTIEHHNPKCPPFIDGVTINLPEPAPEERDIPTGGDPTMRETDDLADVRARLKRRLERAQMMKEIKETERMVKQVERDVENDEKPAPVAGESDEVRKLREKNAELEAKLAEKKVSDRFDKLETSIAALTQTLTAQAAQPAKAAGDDSLILRMLTQSQQHSKDMLDALKATARPAAGQDNDLDKMLERYKNMKAAFGGGDSRVSQFQDKILEAAMDKFLDGGDRGGGDDLDEEQDVLKYGIKQLTPVLKTYVEKAMEKESASGKPITQERARELYAEEASRVSRELEAKLRAEGMRIVNGPGGPAALPAPKGKIPARHVPGSKVVSERRTAEGVVKTVQVEPANLSGKATKSGGQGTGPSSESSSDQGGDSVTKFAELPLIGEGGGLLKIELPAPPGDLKYDRKRAVNFILDSIRSEIAQKIPVDKPNDSFVPGDALELLDEEVLTRISKVENGSDVEAIFAEWGDRAKIDEIKAAGVEEPVKVWLRRLIITVGDTFRDAKAQESAGRQ